MLRRPAPFPELPKATANYGGGPANVVLSGRLPKPDVDPATRQ